MDCSPLVSPVHGVLQAGDLPNLGIKPGSPVLQADFLLKPRGKPLKDYTTIHLLVFMLTDFWIIYDFWRI